MKEVKIAMAMLRQNDVYLFQLRNGAKQTGAEGLIGCFGGKLEKGETGLQAVSREVAEETTLTLAAQHYTQTGNVAVQLHIQDEPVKVRAEVFSAEVPAGLTPEATEGDLVAMTQQEIWQRLDELTPATRASVEKFMARGAP